MYCPRCAANNLDDAKFCRACGADIRLVPQALQGTLPASVGTDKGEALARSKEKKRKPATVDAGLKNIFQGIGLLIIFLIGLFVFRGAFWVTIWFIIPALGSFGEGIGQLIRAGQERQRLTTTTTDFGGQVRTAPLASASGFKELASPDTAEIVSNPPASVTEMTTRHLDAPLKSAAKDV
ncbi:MAG TPA: zinc ribbon domain-containing protein [Pyrinomonadaceae bacterium]|nr:zinc ribbon domain-containing protein [Pyrinomonadaceae bacterium]